MYCNRTATGPVHASTQRTPDRLRYAENALDKPICQTHQDSLERTAANYDGDLDGTEPPEAVADLRRRIREADGLLIATPEYNYSILGVLKSAIDWASRRRRRHRSSTSTLPSWAPRLATSAR